jgi:signal transduction histidine kinase
MFGIRINIERLLLTSEISNKDEVKIYIQKFSDLQSDVRQLSHDLVDDNFKKESFTQLIEDYLSEFENDYNIQTIFKHDEQINWDLCTSNQKFQVFRIIQESLTNVRKYAKASLVSVVFTKKNEKLTFYIKDDGAGYNIKNQNKGIGLKNMQFRMNEIQGALEISSSSKGTLIYGEFTIKH